MELKTRNVLDDNHSILIFMDDHEMVLNYF